MVRWQVEAANGLIVLSDHVGEEAQKVYDFPANRIWTIAHGAFSFGDDKTMARSFPKDQPLRLLFLGRIVKYKGLGLLLDAYRILRERNVPVILDIVGSGSLKPYQDQLEGLEQVNIENKWLEEQEIDAALKRSDIMVLPYIEASQSGVAAAALTAALPLIATPVGGLVEQIIDRQTGLIADAVSAASLADTIEQLATSPHLYETCSAAALDFANSTLGWATIAQDVANISQKVLDLPARPRPSSSQGSVMNEDIHAKSGANLIYGLPVKVRRWRNADGLRWLGQPTAYALGAPLMAVLSAGTTLAAAKLLDPTQFGAFALLSILFLLASKSELGLSQLADRELAAKGGDLKAYGAQILRLRWKIGIILLLAALPLAGVISFLNGTLTLMTTALAIAGGAAFLIANGPVTLYRATHKIWEFTTTALLLQAGLTLPRLAGLMLAGVTGCFSVLLIWYGALALLFARPAKSNKTPSVKAMTLLAIALPLFAFDSSWFLFSLGQPLDLINDHPSRRIWPVRICRQSWLHCHSFAVDGFTGALPQTTGSNKQVR